MEDGMDQPAPKEATVASTENASGGVLLKDVQKKIDERITRAQQNLDKANKKVWEIGPGGIPVTPSGVEGANERLNYLKTARKMFFSVHDTPNTTWDEAVERAEKETDDLYELYKAGFGKTDPKDVDETKREEAEKEMGQIKLRDRIMTEFKNPN